MGFLSKLVDKLKKRALNHEVREYAESQMDDLIAYYKFVYKKLGLLDPILSPRKLARYAMYGVLFVMVHGTPTEGKVNEFLKEMGI